MTAETSPNPAKTEANAAPTVFTIFMLVRTTSDWLALKPEDRFKFLGTTIEPILKRHLDVRMRFFDSEAFNARVSDVVMWQTSSLTQYQSLVDSLRETAFWGHYFDVVEIVTSIENAYAEHYKRQPIGQAA